MIKREVLLQLMMVSNCEARSVSAHHRLCLAIKRFSVDNHIRPMGVFTLTRYELLVTLIYQEKIFLFFLHFRPTLLFLLGLLLTYLVVLLELRVVGHHGINVVCACLNNATSSFNVTPLVT